jgi:hypothetical protein
VRPGPWGTGDTAGVSVMTRRRPAPRTGSTRDWRSILFLLLTVGSIATAIAGAYNFVLLPLLGSFTGPFEDLSA